MFALGGLSVRLRGSSGLLIRACDSRTGGMYYRAYYFRTSNKTICLRSISPNR